MPMGQEGPWHRCAAHLPLQHSWYRHTGISFTAPVNISETFLAWLDMFCKVREGPMWLLKLLPSAKAARHRSGERVTALLSGQQTWGVGGSSFPVPAPGLVSKSLFVSFLVISCVNTGDLRCY